MTVATTATNVTAVSIQKTPFIELQPIDISIDLIHQSNNTDSFEIFPDISVFFFSIQLNVLTIEEKNPLFSANDCTIQNGKFLCDQTDICISLEQVCDGTKGKFY